MSVNKTNLLKKMVEYALENDYWNSVCDEGKEILIEAAKAAKVDITEYIEPLKVAIYPYSIECEMPTSTLEVNQKDFSVNVEVFYKGKSIYTQKNIDFHDFETYR